MRLPEYTVLLFFCAWRLVWCGLFPLRCSPAQRDPLLVMPFAFSLALPLLAGVSKLLVVLVVLVLMLLLVRLGSPT